MVNDTEEGHRGAVRRGRRYGVALLLGACLALLVGVLPIGNGGAQVASAHALLVRSDPAADAVLGAPPSEVRMWFSEDVNTLTSRAIVVDPTNRQVDRQDSHVNSSNPRELDLSLPLLKAGAYIVDWRTQSAEDGHIVGGSFIFRIARPDGTIPPVPSQLPTGHIPGAGGTISASGTSLDGPTVVQALGVWGADLFLALWLGGLIWETWVFAPGGSPDLALVARHAQRRFRRIAPYVLGFLLAADVLIVVGQSAQLADDWRGAFSPPLLRAVLFGSHFGLFWWLRQGVALAALALTLVATRRGWLAGRLGDTAATTPPIEGAPATVSDWRREVVLVLRGIPHLPMALADGWRARSWLGRGELALGSALVLAFALSGHAAAVAASEVGYALSVDTLHLVCTAVWVGGLLYIAAVLIPAQRDASERVRARVLAQGLPRFSVLALVSVAVLSATGTLNATIHLTSIQQLITTAYGRTLAVKIEIFLVMVGISSYHAFFLRPRLAAALAEQEQAAAVGVIEATLASVGGGAAGHAVPGAPAEAEAGSLSAAEPDGLGLSPRARDLAERLEDWLRREAILGAGVLLCVALLAAFAGSLAIGYGAPANATGTGSNSGGFVQTQSADGYSLTLRVEPASFGTNTFTVVVKDGHDKPVTGAGVLIQTIMLDMDMGVQNGQLQPVGASQPGVYTGQSDLTMAGNWQIGVKVVPPNSQQTEQATFKIVAGA